MKLSICRPWPTRKNAAAGKTDTISTSRAAARPYEMFTGGASGDRLRPTRRHTAMATSAAPAATRNPSRARDTRLSTRDTTTAIIASRTAATRHGIHRPRQSQRRANTAYTPVQARNGISHASRTRSARRRTASPTAMAVANRNNDGTRSRYCLDRAGSGHSHDARYLGTAIRIAMHAPTYAPLYISRNVAVITSQSVFTARTLFLS